MSITASFTATAKHVLSRDHDTLLVERAFTSIVMRCIPSDAINLVYFPFRTGLFGFTTAKDVGRNRFDICLMLFRGLRLLLRFLMQFFGALLFSSLISIYFQWQFLLWLLFWDLLNLLLCGLSFKVEATRTEIVIILEISS